MGYKDVDRQKEAQRAHYLANKEAYNARVAVLREKKRSILRQAKDVPCVDCGIKYPYYVMQFDHLGDKEFTLSDLSKVSLAKVHQEIAKCEVVCANCHAERSHTRRAHS